MEQEKEYLEMMRDTSNLVAKYFDIGENSGIFLLKRAYFEVLNA